MRRLECLGAIYGIIFALAVMTARPAWADDPACVGDQLSTAAATTPAAGALLDQAIAAIDNPSNDDLDRLQTWFGVNSSTGAAKVRQTYVNAKAFLPGISYLCAVQSSLTKKDAYARVLPTNSFAVVLAAFFWDAPVSGFDSQPGVFVHEMTHFLLVGATQDYAYGRDDAKALAVSDPGKAQMNADNYEYFAEATSAHIK